MNSHQKIFCEALDVTTKVFFVFPFGTMDFDSPDAIEVCQKFWNTQKNIIKTIIEEEKSVEIVLLHNQSDVALDNIDRYKDFFAFHRTRLRLVCDDTVNNVWIRDYMPVGITDSQAIKARYYPTYFENPQCGGKKGERILAEPANRLTHFLVKDLLGLTIECLTYNNRKIVLDGGNFVHNATIGFISARVLTENLRFSEVYETNREMIERFLCQHKAKAFVAHLKKSLFLKKLYIIPCEAGEKEDVPEETGHIDGSIRFIKSNLLAIDRDYFERNSDYLQSIFEVNSLKYELFTQDFERDTLYLNYLRVNNTVLLPKAKQSPKDFQALKKVCRKNNLKTIEIEENRHIFTHGGVFNCISWQC